MWVNLFLTVIGCYSMAMTSCSSNSAQEKFEMKSLHLAIDDNQSYEADERTLLRMFVYMDSTICHKCMLVNTRHWEEFREFALKTQGRFSISYVIESPTHNENLLSEYIKLLKFKNNVYFCSDSLFHSRMRMSRAYKSGQPYVFMLDKDRNFLIDGNPEANPIVNRQYRRIIDSVIDVDSK